MNKNKINLVFIALAILLLSGCSTNTHYISKVPPKVSMEDDDNLESYKKQDYATITCSEGETEITGLFGLGWSTPTLRLTFDTHSMQMDLFNSYYEAIRVAPGNRDFTLKYKFGSKYSNIKVRDFTFKPNTNYFAYYSLSGNKLSVWIEKKDKTVVFGSKPKEGSF